MKKLLFLLLLAIVSIVSFVAFRSVAHARSEVMTCDKVKETMRSPVWYNVYPKRLHSVKMKEYKKKGRFFLGKCRGY